MQQDLRIGGADAGKEFVADDRGPSGWKSDRYTPRRHVEHARRVALGDAEAILRDVVPVEHGAGLGQQNSLRATRNELASELGLEAGEMMAEGGLRDMHLIGGAREAAGLHDPDEVTKLAQVHGCDLRLPLHA